MKINLNNKVYEVDEGTCLSAFIDSLDIGKEGIAIAISYEVIPRDRWNETILSENMDLMLIRAVSGG